MPPLTPMTPPTPTPPPKPSHGRSWVSMRRRANTVSGVIVLLLTILIIGAVAGFGIGHLHRSATSTKTQVQTLSPSDLSKLSQVGGTLGSSGQTLSIGADSVFKGKVDVAGDFSVGGRLSANGPVVLSQLDITGTSALAGLSVGSNLTVGGTTTLQKSLTVGDLVTINGGLNVSGSASIANLNANIISVHSLSLSGPIIISHLQTQGTTPSGTAGSAVGGGGTVSISGNDAAGTVNINTGSNPPAGILITVVFRAAYSATPHVLLTPLTGPAAATPVYVTRTSTGFQIRVDSAPSAGAILSYDYFITQ